MADKPKREVAVSFLKLASSGKVSEAFEKYVHRQSFRHHNPHFRGDAASLRTAMMEANTKFPDTTLEILRVFESDEEVAVHSRVIHSPKGPEISVVHIFGFQRDRITELWDLGIQAAKDSPNENGLF